MSLTERGPRKDYRTASDLRTQFLCEYRLYLQNIHGNQETKWSRRGRELHNQSAIAEQIPVRRNKAIRILLIISIVVFGILWIVS